MADPSRTEPTPLALALGRVPSGLFILTVRRGEHATGLEDLRGLLPAIRAAVVAAGADLGAHLLERGVVVRDRGLDRVGGRLGRARSEQQRAGGGRVRQRVQVGVLECRGAASVGFIVGSVTNLGCVFRSDNMPEDRYVAPIRKVGLDLGITQESALACAFPAGDPP